MPQRGGSLTRQGQASELQLGLDSLLEMYSSASSAVTSSNAALAAANQSWRLKLSWRQEESGWAEKGIIGHFVNWRAQRFEKWKEEEEGIGRLCVATANYNDMLAFMTTDMQGRLEERKMKRDRDRTEKLALKTKKLELKKERGERNLAVSGGREQTNWD